MPIPVAHPEKCRDSSDWRTLFVTPSQSERNPHGKSPATDRQIGRPRAGSHRPGTRRGSPPTRDLAWWRNCWRYGRRRGRRLSSPHPASRATHPSPRWTAQPGGEERRWPLPRYRRPSHREEGCVDAHPTELHIRNTRAPVRSDGPTRRADPGARASGWRRTPLQPPKTRSRHDPLPPCRFDLNYSIARSFEARHSTHYTHYTHAHPPINPSTHPPINAPGITEQARMQPGSVSPDRSPAGDPASDQPHQDLSPADLTPIDSRFDSISFHFARRSRPDRSCLRRRKNLEG